MTPEESHVCRNTSEKSTTPEESNVLKLIDDAMSFTFDLSEVVASMCIFLQTCDACLFCQVNLWHQSTLKHIGIKYISQWYYCIAPRAFRIHFASSSGLIPL